MDNEWTMVDVARVAIEVGLAVARESGEITNGDAAKKLSLLQSKLGELVEAVAPIASIADVEIDGEHVSFTDVVEFYRVSKATEREAELEQEAVTLAVSELRIESLKKSLRDTLAILDALTAKDKPADSTDETAAETPDIDVSESAPVVEEPLIEFDEGDVEQGDVEERGHALAIIEEGDGTYAAPLKMHVAIIEPGMGNAKMGRYYGAPMLRENAHKLKGAKMYPVNHRNQDKTAGNEVSIVLDCPVGFTESGGPIALVGVFDEAFARNVRNRAALDRLNTLECSILGDGKMRKGKVNGKEAYIVESIDTVESVDWVTKAGAGGRALEIIENEDRSGDMTQEVVEEVAGVAETEVVETEPAAVVVEVEGDVQKAPLAEAAVAEAVDQTSLPQAFKAALKAREYANDTALAQAVDQAIKDYAAATGSGRPFGLGTGTKQEKSVVAESAEAADERRQERYKRILAEHGVA